MPQWLFGTYSDLPVTAEGDKTVTRYAIHEDHRVVVERSPGCGGQPITREFTWEIRGPNELTLLPPSEDESGSSLYSAWVLSHGDECDPVELDGIRKSDGARADLGQLHRGAVCSAKVPPPEDWAGEWDECDWSWCEMAPVDACEP